MSQQKQGRWFGWFAGLVIVAGITALVFLISSPNKSFPPLPQGAFVGQITGLAAGEKKQTTLYVERVTTAQSLLFVVFDAGWRPQLVPMTRLYDENQVPDNTLTEEIPLQPVIVTNDKITFTLTGKKDFNQYSGEVVGSNGTRGVWSISAVSMAALSSDSQYLSYNEAMLREWLTRKAAFLDLKRAIRETSQQLETDQQKLANLKKFIVDEKLLTERATQRRQALAAELEQGRAEKELAAQEVNGLIGELEMLSRITKRGRAITLARQVAFRENKWYSANWSAQEDTAGLEEFATTTAGIDIRALEAELASAKEKRALQREIAEEKARIAALKKQLIPAEVNGEAQAMPDDLSAQPRHKGTAPQPSFWDKLWGTP